MRFCQVSRPILRKTCRLGGASLDAGQYRLGVSQRQADRLQSVSALVEVQDCVFADHIVVVTDDPELDLEAHACPKGCHCGSARLSAADIPDQTPSPTLCHAPPHGRLLLTLLGGLAEFERDLIRTRTGEGRARAKARGVKLGRPPKLTPHQKREAIERRDKGEALTEIARTYNVSHSTISRLKAQPRGSEKQPRK
jgi:hypothetical protein